MAIQAAYIASITAVFVTAVWRNYGLIRFLATGKLPEGMLDNIEFNCSFEIEDPAVRKLVEQRICDNPHIQQFNLDDIILFLTTGDLPEQVLDILGPDDWFVDDGSVTAAIISRSGAFFPTAG